MIGQFLQKKRLIAHYYIVVGLATLLFGWLARNEEILDMTIIVILAVYVLLFPIVILYTKKYAIHIFLFLLALITGFYSYYHYSVEPHSILNALYFTFQLFLLVVTDVFTNDGSSMLHYPLIVEIARWSAALYTISTFFIAIYHILESSILLVFYQIVGKHYIIFGYNENSMTFIENLRKEKKRVVLVANHIPAETIDYLETLKVVVLYHRDNDENIYIKCGVMRARAIVLFHKNDIDNLNEFMDIQYTIENHIKKKLELTIYIHLLDATSKRLFLDLNNTIIERKQFFHVQFINVYESFVAELFQKHPIHKTNQNQTKTPLHLLIIGFGSLGQHIALKAITELKNNLSYITAIDKQMPKRKQEWQLKYAQLDQQLALFLHKLDIEENQLEPMIRNQKIPITHIYICLREDTLNLLAGIELSNHFPQIPIYLEFNKNSIIDHWIQSEFSGTRLIYGTGTLEDILTEDNLFKKTHRQ